MKKSDLIALLNSIEGNPEIKLWNGFVEDWVDIENKLHPLELVKLTKAEYIKRITMQECIRKKDWNYELSEDEIEKVEKLYNQMKWEYKQFVTSEDIEQGRYKVKNVFLLQAKIKGEKTFDRCGDIEY